MHGFIKFFLRTKFINPFRRVIVMNDKDRLADTVSQLISITDHLRKMLDHMHSRLNHAKDMSSIYTKTTQDIQKANEADLLLSIKNPDLFEKLQEEIRKILPESLKTKKTEIEIRKEEQDMQQMLKDAMRKYEEVLGVHDEKEQTPDHVESSRPVEFQDELLNKLINKGKKYDVEIAFRKGNEKDIVANIDKLYTELKNYGKECNLAAADLLEKIGEKSSEIPVLEKQVGKLLELIDLYTRKCITFMNSTATTFDGLNKNLFFSIKPDGDTSLN
jgi:hypothetical protein